MLTNTSALLKGLRILKNEVELTTVFGDNLNAVVGMGLLVDFSHICPYFYR